MSKSRKKIVAIALLLAAAAILLAMLLINDSGGNDSRQEVVAKKVVVKTQTHPGTLAAGLYKPTTNWCPTVHLCFTQISWKKYGDYSASGWGTIKACPPSASKSRCSTFKGTASLYNITTRCGQPQFNQLKIKAQGQSFAFGLDSECRMYTGNSGAFLGAKYAGFAYAQNVKVVTCNIKVHHQQMLTSAKGISCQDAAEDLIAADLQPTFTTPLGFLCQPIEGSENGSEYRCVRDEQAYRFKFGY